jgi:hypothetical protein
MVHLLSNVYDTEKQRGNYVSYSQVEHCGRKEKFSPLWKVLSSLYCSTLLYLSQCFPPSQLHYSWWAVLSIKLVSLLNVAGKFYVHDQLHLLCPLFSCFWTHSVAQCCFWLPKSTSCECVTWKEHDMNTAIRNKKLGLRFAVLDCSYLLEFNKSMLQSHICLVLNTTCKHLCYYCHVYFCELVSHI